MSRFFVLGRIVAPHGIRGAVKVLSFADPPESLLQHRHWRLRRADAPRRDGPEDMADAADAAGEAGLARVEVIEARAQGAALYVRLAGVEDRDAAEALREREILIAREERPALRAHEYLREDLLGFTVRNLEGTVLGTLLHFLDAPAGALMVVGGERERWLPAGPPHLRRVLPEQRVIEVDWPADF